MKTLLSRRAAILGLALALPAAGVSNAPAMTGLRAFSAPAGGRGAWTPGFSAMPAESVVAMKTLLASNAGAALSAQAPAFGQLSSADPASLTVQSLLGALTPYLPIGFDFTMQQALRSGRAEEIERAVDAVASAHRKAAPLVAAAAKARALELAAAADAMSSAELEAAAAEMSLLSFYGGQAAEHAAAVSQLAMAKRQTGTLVSAGEIAAALSSEPPVRGDLSQAPRGSAPPALSMPASVSAAAKPSLALAKAYSEKIANSGDEYDSLKLADKMAALAAQGPDEAVHRAVAETLANELSEDGEEDYVVEVARRLGDMAAASPFSAVQDKAVTALMNQAAESSDADFAARLVPYAGSIGARSQDPKIKDLVYEKMLEELKGSSVDEYNELLAREAGRVAGTMSGAGLHSAALPSVAPEDSALSKANRRLVEAIIEKLGSADDYFGELQYVRRLADAAGRERSEILHLRLVETLANELSDASDDDYARDVADALGAMAAASPYVSVHMKAVEAIMAAAEANSDADYARRFVANVGPLAALSPDAQVKRSAHDLLLKEYNGAADDGYAQALSEQIEMITGEAPKPVVRAAEVEEEPVSSAPIESPAKSPARRLLGFLSTLIVWAFGLYVSYLAVRHAFQ